MVNQAEDFFFLDPESALFVSDPDPGKNEIKKITNNQNCISFMLNCTENTVE